MCGECSIDDFDFEAGNFKCSSSDYTSHWWTKEELASVLRENYPGDKDDLEITFEVMGVGIFAICSIKQKAAA